MQGLSNLTAKASRTLREFASSFRRMTENESEEQDVYAKAEEGLLAAGHESAEENGTM